MYVGMDIHKKSIQISMVYPNGRELSNTKIPNTIQDIDEFFADVPHDAALVMESSSVSQNVFLHLRRSGYDPVLSNPYKTKPIAYAKIKTDKIDAHTLAEMLRGDFIPKCYVPPKRIRDARYLIRHRKNLSDMRKRLKHKTHAVLLGGGIRIKGTTFSKPYVKKLRGLNDYRIGDYLDVLDLIADKIREADGSIRDHIDAWPDDSAKVLLTVPGDRAVHRAARTGGDRGHIPVSQLRPPVPVRGAGALHAQLRLDDIPRPHNQTGQRPFAVRHGGVGAVAPHRTPRRPYRRILRPDRRQERQRQGDGGRRRQASPGRVLRADRDARVHAGGPLRCAAPYGPARAEGLSAWCRNIWQCM